MDKFLRPGIRDSISTRLLKVVFLFYLVIAVAVTLMHMVIQYRDTKKKVIHDLKIFQKTYESGLANILWSLDHDQLLVNMRGMLEVPVITGVRVEETEGKVWGVGMIMDREGNKAAFDSRGKRIDLTGEMQLAEIYAHTFPVDYYYNPLQQMRVGTCTLYSSSRVVLERVQLVFLLIILNAVIKTMALWVIFFLVSRVLLNRPLADLTRACEQLDLDNLEQEEFRIRTKGRNELKILEGAFNAMVRKLHLAHVERKLAEHSLRESENRLQAILENTIAVVYLKDVRGHYLLVNRQYEKIMSLSREMICGKSDYDLFPKAIADEMRKNDRKVIVQKAPLQVEERISHSNGLKTYISIKFPMYDDDGKLYGVCGISTDITDRKQVEVKLERLRKYLKNIIDSMPSVLVGVDMALRVTQWNIAAEKVTGVVAEEAMGKEIDLVFPELSGEMDKIGMTLREGLTKKDTRLALVIDGETRYFNTTIYPLVDKDVQGAVIHIDDVTDRLRIEEIMIQTEKMMSVGGLAAGMAHEINNPLAGILQNMQVLINRLSKDLPANVREAEASGTTLSAIKEYMERRGIYSMIRASIDAGDRASQIVKNMLVFSRKSETGFVPLNMGELLDITVELAASDYDLKQGYDFRQIEIVREYDPAVPDVPCDPTRIQQVFLNILKNGAQAMAGAMERGVYPRFILRVRAEADGVRIEIEDNGPGMNETTCRRVFEPFFTTKAVGVGTGLGMSVSYFIITETHGGTLSVASAPGKGATFIIRLPFKNVSHEVKKTPETLFPPA